MYPEAYMSLELHDARSLSSPEGPQVVAEPVLRTIGEIGIRLYISHVRG